MCTALAPRERDIGVGHAFSWVQTDDRKTRLTFDAGLFGVESFVNSTPHLANLLCRFLFFYRWCRALYGRVLVRTIEDVSSRILCRGQFSPQTVFTSHGREFVFVDGVWRVLYPPMIPDFSRHRAWAAGVSTYRSSVRSPRYEKTSAAMSFSKRITILLAVL